MYLFQTLLRPDHEEFPERAEVGRAANLLQIGEFQFLQLAYREWFGDDLAPGAIDGLFDSYMLSNQVPFWARQYARKISERAKAGMLDDNDPTYHCYDAHFVDHVPNGGCRFAVAVTVVIGILGGGILAGHYATGGGGTSVLPPYFNDGELDPNADKRGT